MSLSASNKSNSRKKNVTLRSSVDVASCQGGGQTLLLKNYRTRDFIVKCIFRVIREFPRSLLSEIVIFTFNITNFKCKNSPAPLGMTSTGRVQTKLLLSAIVLEIFLVLSLSSKAILLFDKK